MRTVEWSTPARRQFNAYIDYLIIENPRAAERASKTVLTAARRLATHPFIARASRWPGLRELSLTRWRKIVVYKVEGQLVRIVALYDARQDLTKVKPQE